MSLFIAAFQGASGWGKSEVVERTFEILKRRSRFECLEFAVDHCMVEATRKKRKKPSAHITSVTPDDFQARLANRDYIGWFRNEGNDYGIPRFQRNQQAVDYLLENGHILFLQTGCAAHTKLVGEMRESGYDVVDIAIEVTDTEENRRRLRRRGGAAAVRREKTMGKNRDIFLRDRDRENFWLIENNGPLDIDPALRERYFWLDEQAIQKNVLNVIGIVESEVKARTNPPDSDPTEMTIKIRPTKTKRQRIRHEDSRRAYVLNRLNILFGQTTPQQITGFSVEDHLLEHFLYKDESVSRRTLDYFLDSQVEVVQKGRVTEVVVHQRADLPGATTQRDLYFDLFRHLLGKNVEFVERARKVNKLEEEKTDLDRALEREYEEDVGCIIDAPSSHEKHPKLRFRFAAKEDSLEAFLEENRPTLDSIRERLDDDTPLSDEEVQDEYGDFLREFAEKVVMRVHYQTFVQKKMLS